MTSLSIKGGKEEARDMGSSVGMPSKTGLSEVDVLLGPDVGVVIEIGAFWCTLPRGWFGRKLGCKAVV